MASISLFFMPDFVFNIASPSWSFAFITPHMFKRGGEGGGYGAGRAGWCVDQWDLEVFGEVRGCIKSQGIRGIRGIRVRVHAWDIWHSGYFLIFWGIGYMRTPEIHGSSI